jgi:hypothetical protein
MRKHYLMMRAIGMATLFGLGFWLLDSIIHPRLFSSRPTKRIGLAAPP